jgi:hypothetical protein
MVGKTRLDGMSEKDDDRPKLSAPGQRAAEQRRQRLAAALRENLRKRKVQGRSRSGGPPPKTADRAADGGMD